MSARDFAINYINSNPQVIAQNPVAQGIWNVIQNGDMEQAKTIAHNICDTYGISYEEAVTRAKNAFGIS